MAVVIFGFNYRVMKPEQQDVNTTGTSRIYESDAVRKILDMRDPSRTLSSSGKDSVTAYLSHKKQTIFIRRPEVIHQENLPQPEKFAHLKTTDNPAVYAVAAARMPDQPQPEMRKSAIAVFDQNGKEVLRFDSADWIKSSKPLCIKVVRHGLLSRAEKVSGGGDSKFDTFCLDKISSSALAGGT